MLSLVQFDQYWQVILAQGLGMGIGVGLCYVPALVTAALHFPGKQAIAMVPALLPAYLILLNLCTGHCHFFWFIWGWNIL